MSAVVAVGIGASGEGALHSVRASDADLDVTLGVIGRSRVYANPAWGGATRAPFCNAVVIVPVRLPLQGLYACLRAIERCHGRVRGERNAARTLDLDILWASGILGDVGAGDVVVPHPRLARRGFAIVPLVEALDAAGVPVGPALRQAAASLTLSPPLTPVSALRSPPAASRRP